jgi:hypothetical protein
MISPSYSLSATERVLPRMALDFTTATLDSRVTFARTGNTATVTNSSGVIVGINANLPRFDFDPTTLVCKGLLIEEARTNLLLNSLLNGTNLSTQLVTTTAVAHTLSFYGTGQIILSGSSTATVVGTGAYPSRRTLTFTPTAGVLTLTVTGTVQYAQLEVGGFATSFIPTDASQVTRTADVATMTGTNFSSWYNASEGALFAQASTFSNAATDKFIANINNNGFPNRILMIFSALNNFSASVVSNSVSQVSGNNGSVIPLNTSVKMCFATKLNNFAWSQAATTPSTDSLGAMPVVVDRLWIGSATTSSFLNGHMQQVKYWPQRLINAEVQAFSK